MFIIDIQKELVPYSFDIELNNNFYKFTIKYNQEYDHYTIDLELEDEELIAGEKILLGKELFSDYKHLNVPRDIMPLDIADIATRCGINELGESVFLYLVGDIDEV